MHLCILTAGYTVTPVLRDHLKKINYSLMEVKGIAECSKALEHSAILLTSIKLPFDIKIFVLSFLSGCLRMFYCIDNLHVLSVYVESIDSLFDEYFFIKVRFFHN